MKQIWQKGHMQEPEDFGAKPNGEARAATAAATSGDLRRPLRPHSEDIRDEPRPTRLSSQEPVSPPICPSARWSGNNCDVRRHNPPDWTSGASPLCETMKHETR